MSIFCDNGTIVLLLIQFDAVCLFVCPCVSPEPELNHTANLDHNDTIQPVSINLYLEDSFVCLFFRLNTNKALYQALKTVVNNGDVQELTDVDKRVAELFLFDFEQSGIHLEEDKASLFVFYPVDFVYLLFMPPSHLVFAKTVHFSVIFHFITLYVHSNQSPIYIVLQ